MTQEFSPIYIHRYCGINAIGSELEEMQMALLGLGSPNKGLLSNEYSPKHSMFLGGIQGLPPFPLSLENVFNNRNNALLHEAFLKIKPEWERMTHTIAPSKIAIIIGSSNAGIEEGEKVIAALSQSSDFPEGYDYARQEYGSPARFLAKLLNTNGPAYSISTACSSSAKAFISAARLLQANVCDIALVGGSDTLSQLTVNGFLSLEAIDGQRCQPFAENRKGIHLGEAAALFILSREPSSIKLAGWGESSDAYHMAAPQPEGLGAEKSMREALRHARISAQQIDYINLHGTATAQNDVMEAAAVARIFGNRVPISSTKPHTGHTLGASGATEALFSCLTLAQKAFPYKLPMHWIDSSIDSQLPDLNFVRGVNTVSTLKYILSNSFGFGGSNASLIFERVVS